MYFEDYEFEGAGTKSIFDGYFEYLDNIVNSTEELPF